MPAVVKHKQRTSAGCQKGKMGSLNAEAFLARKNDILHSRITCYQILDFIGEGHFSKVAKCVDLNTGKIVALKISKTKSKVNDREVTILETVRALDPHRNNIVKYFDGFSFLDHYCLAFEILDKRLCDLMQENKSHPLSLSEIRCVTRQILVAFEALKSIGIVHSDLKPDNIMLVNHKDQPFKVKLIDFGLALPVSRLHIGMNMQILAFRAPEVVLGLPLSEAVDMWGVGCTMAFMYFGKSLFPSKCPYHWIRTILHLLGQPDNHQITSGRYSLQYFVSDEQAKWRLRTPLQFMKVSGFRPEISKRFTDLARDFEDLIARGRKQTCDDIEDRLAFLDLLKRCLHLNSIHRICPSKALEHCFTSQVKPVDEMEMVSTVNTEIGLGASFGDYFNQLTESPKIEQPRTLSKHESKPVSYDANVFTDQTSQKKSFQKIFEIYSRLKQNILCRLL